MSDYRVPQYVVDQQHKRALANRPRPCMLCRQWTQTRLWPCGWHCNDCARSRGLQVDPMPGAYPEHLRQRRHHIAQEAPS